MRRIDIFINCKNCSKILKVTPSILRQGVKCCSRSCGQSYLWKQDWYRTKQISSHKGIIPSNIQDLIAYTRSKEGREATSKRTKGRVGWNKGKKMPEIAGENHYSWIKDRTEQLEKHRLRGTLEWRNWRTAVFERDNYTCKECGQYGGYLEPNHIIPLRSNMERIFDINNGITLCRPCHVKTIWKEEQFSGKYSQLVADSV